MNKVFKTFSFLFICTIIVKIIDVAKNLYVASFLGVSDSADIYLSLISLPDSIIVLLGLDTIRGVANSEFSSVFSIGKIKELKYSFQLILKYLMILGVVISFILYLLRGYIIDIFLPGFSGIKYELSYTVITFILPIFFLKILIGYIISVNNSMKKYYLPLLASSVISITIIASVLSFHHLGEIVYNLAIANLIGNCIYLVILLFLSSKLLSNFDWKSFKVDKLSKKIIYACLTTLVLVFVNQAYMSSRNFFLSYFPAGSISSVNYSQSITGIISALVFTSIFGIMLTNLSGLFSENKNEEARELFWNTLLHLSYLMVPIVLIFLTCSTEIVSIIYLRGSFTVENVLLTVKPFKWEALSMFAFILYILPTALYLAKKKYFLLTMLGSAVYIFGILLNYFLSDSVGYFGISIAGFIVALLYGLLLIFFTYNFWDKPWLKLKKLFTLVLCGGLTILVYTVAEQFLYLDIEGIVYPVNTELFINLFIKTTIVLLAYFLFTTLMKVSYINKLIFILKK